MPKNTLIAVIVIIVIIVIGIGIYYYFSQGKITPSPGEGVTGAPENKFGLQEYMLEAYPDYLEGTISFSEETAATLTTTDGKVYKLQPGGPKYYWDEGIKDGQKVAIQGKIVMDEYLTVGVIE